MAVSQSFLGTTTVGASTVTPGTDKTYAKKITVPAGALVVSVDFYCDPVDGEDIAFQYALYEDNAGQPGKMIACRQALTNTLQLDGNARWVSGGLGVPFSSETDVWAAVHFIDRGTSTIAYDGSGTDYEIDAGGAWIIEAGAAGASQSSAGNDYSIRVSVVTGLTFATQGDAAAGASVQAMTSGRYYAKKVTLSEDDVLATIAASLIQPVANVPTLICAVWDDNSGSPGNLLFHGVNGQQQILMSNNAREFHLPVGMRIPAAGDYWLGVGMFGSTSVSIAYDGSGSDGYAASASDSPTFTGETRDYSIEANVITGASILEVGAASVGASDQSPVDTTMYLIPATLPGTLLVGFEVAARASSGTEELDGVAGLFVDDTGAPGSLVAYSGRRNLRPTIGTTVRWFSLGIMSWIVDGDFWLGVKNRSGSAQAKIAYDTGVSGDGYTIQGDIGQVDEPGVTGAVSTVQSRAYSIRAILIESSPAAPSDPSATALSSSSIQVDWTDNATDETGYRVERSPNGTTGWVDVSGSLPPGSVTYTDTGLTAATTYYYRVIAFNAAGDSDPSTVVNATTLAAPAGAGRVLPSPTTRRLARRTGR